MASLATSCSVKDGALAIIFCPTAHCSLALQDVGGFTVPSFIDLRRDISVPSVGLEMV